MKRTKILAKIAIAAAMLSLAGCGNNADSNTSVSDIPEDSASAVTETTETPTEEVPETTTAIEETTDEPVTETPTEAPTEADIELDIDNMTIAMLENIADKILTGNTDTVDDMAATLFECGFEFNADEEEKDYDNQSIHETLKNPIIFSDFENLSIDSIFVAQTYDDNEQLLPVVTFVLFSKRSDYNEEFDTYANLVAYLVNNGYSVEDNGMSSDRFSNVGLAHLGGVIFLDFIK